MTEKRDAPEATAATGAHEAASKSSSDEKSDDGQIGRRKLLYAAPAIMSQSMFYALAGCGKAQPQQINCFRVPRSGS